MPPPTLFQVLPSQAAMPLQPLLQLPAVGKMPPTYNVPVPLGSRAFTAPFTPPPTLFQVLPAQAAIPLQPLPQLPAVVKLSPAISVPALKTNANTLLFIPSPRGFHRVPS